MPNIDPQTLRDLSEGIVQGVDPSIVPTNSAYLAENLEFSANLGRAVLRDGITQLGSQMVSEKPCLGLYEHITTGGTEIPLAVFDDSSSTNSDLFAYSGGSWSKEQEDLTVGKDCDFETFIDTTLLVNGTDGPYASTDGTSWTSSGTDLDVGNMPNGKYVKEFHNRIYTAGVSGEPDRLYFSSTPSSGSISWSEGDGYIDVEKEEGAGPITGLAKVPGYLLIFKERSMKRWDTNSTHPDSLIKIGCPSQDAIVETAQSVFYFNKRGIYQTSGKYPQKISRRIQDIIDAIPSSYYSEVSGWGDGENVYFSIGDIEVDGWNLNNAVVAYSISNQTWNLYTFPQEFKKWGTYVDGSTETMMAGDTDGNIWQVLEGSTDAGDSINYMLQFQPQEFKRLSRVTDLGSIVVFSKNVRDGNIFWRRDGEGNFEPLGTINESVEKINKSMRGHYFDFRISGQGRDEVEVIGLNFPSINMNLSQDE